MIKSRHKIFLCSIITLLMLAVSILTCLGMVFNYVGEDIAVIRTGNSVIKLQLTEKVTLEDDTMDKLSKKIRVVSASKTGSLDEVVKVTDNNVMFGYKFKGEKYYFSAIGDKLDNENKATYTTTTGTVNIYNASQLKALRDNVNGGDTYEGSRIYIQSEISLANQEWTPIGTLSNKFKGTVVGNNYKISNLKITVTPDNAMFSLGGAGLFGVAEDAKFSKIKMCSVNINVKNFIYCGALVGVIISNSYNGCSVSDCSVDQYSKINMDSCICVGGLIGAAQNTKIYNCGAYASVYSTKGTFVGGLAGCVTQSTYLSSCESRAKILMGSAKEMHVGGVVGSTYADTVSNGSVVIDRSIFNGSIGLAASGNVEVENLIMGGIVGSMRTFTTITNCVANVSNFAMGELNIKATDHVGKFSNRSNQGGDSAYDIYQFFKLIYPIYGGFCYTMTAESKIVLGLIPVGKTSVNQYTMKPAYRPTYFIGVSNVLFSPDNYISKVAYMDFVVSKNYFTGSSYMLNSDWSEYAERKTDI